MIYTIIITIIITITIIIIIIISLLLLPPPPPAKNIYLKIKISNFFSNQLIITYYIIL